MGIDTYEFFIGVAILLLLFVLAFANKSRGGPRLTQTQATRIKRVIGQRDRVEYGEDW
jgi:hypothetical protein